MKKNNLKVVKIDKNKSLFNYEKKILIKDLTLDLMLGYYDFEKDKLTFKPTDDDIYKNFVDRFFMVVDRETQFITIEFDHFSPYFAQEALFKLINEVNSEVRRREVDRTKKSIEYLNNQVEKTSSVDLKFLFNKLREFINS